MGKNKAIDRLAFLSKKFNIFNLKNDYTETDLNEITSHNNFNTINGHNDNVLALRCASEIKKIKPNGSEVIKTKLDIYISDDVFNMIIKSDPTLNKIYTQWILNLFLRLLKNEETINEAIRLVEEDLPLAEVYLKLFENNKRKQKFKRLCSSSYILKDIKDPTNINQYKSLSQLYDAIDPFIERDPSEMETLIQKFVDSGQAEISVRCRKFTVYIPKTRDANSIFNKFVNWCTATPGNGMFSHYTNHKSPNNPKSVIYIVINNKFFNGELEDNYLYQIHFESNQIKNRKQNKHADFFNDVINESEIISNYFYDVLTPMATQVGTNKNNTYLDYLIKFGWTQVLFDIIEEFTPIIRILNRDVPKLADLSRFTKLNTLAIANAKLSKLHKSLKTLINLKELIIPNNKLTSLPKEIGTLQNLIFLNILGNKITEIPDEIKFLDKTNGGNLYRLAVNPKDIGKDNYNKLRKLLPSVEM